MRPLTVEDLRSISAAYRIRGTREALRDRAAILLGFTTALRRGSLAELRTSDVSFEPRGLVVRVRHEKQDQYGKGREIGVPAGNHPDTNAASCLLDWLRVRGARDGPLFTHVRTSGFRAISGATIGRIVKLAVASIGLDVKQYAGHSMRAGFITSAGEAGVAEWLIAAQTGHRSMEILRRYFRRTHLFRANACHALDL
jgi:integrase